MPIAVARNVANIKIQLSLIKAVCIYLQCIISLFRFIPYDGHQQYINFVQDSGYCRSPMGMLHKGQNLWLNDRCYDHGTIVHELIHALGKQLGTIYYSGKIFTVARPVSAL